MSVEKNEQQEDIMRMLDEAEAFLVSGAANEVVGECGVREMANGMLLNDFTEAAHRC